MVDEKRMKELEETFRTSEDRRDPEFKAFMRETPPPGRVQQPGNKCIFQTLHYDGIGLPALWSPDDMSRGVVEGWGIGHMVELAGSRFMGSSGKQQQTKRPPISSTVCIGKFSMWHVYKQVGSATFISDQDAHEWVAEQANRKGEQFGVYRRALAVVAALTLRRIE